MSKPRDVAGPARPVAPGRRRWPSCWLLTGWLYGSVSSDLADQQRQREAVLRGQRDRRVAGRRERRSRRRRVKRWKARAAAARCPCSSSPAASSSRRRAPRRRRRRVRSSARKSRCSTSRPRCARPARPTSAKVPCARRRCRSTTRAMASVTVSVPYRRRRQVRRHRAVACARPGRGEGLARRRLGARPGLARAARSCSGSSCA